jgi:excisionase family DNA binding protein
VARPRGLIASGLTRRGRRRTAESLDQDFRLVRVLTIVANESIRVRQPKVKPVDEEHRLLTVREVADAMRVSTMTVYRLIRSGSLGAIRVGKHFRVRTRDLEGYLEAQSTRGGDAWPAA